MIDSDSILCLHFVSSLLGSILKIEPNRQIEHLNFLQEAPAKVAGSAAWQQRDQNDFFQIWVNKMT